MTRKSFCSTSTLGMCFWMLVVVVSLEFHRASQWLVQMASMRVTPTSTSTSTTLIQQGTPLDTTNTSTAWTTTLSSKEAPPVDGSRVFQPFQGSLGDLCDSTGKHKRKQRDNQEGLLYFRMHKTSSTTCAGINMAMAHHLANSYYDYKNSQYHNQSTSSLKQSALAAACPHQDQQSYSKSTKASFRDPTKSWLWTMVRHPAHRDLSHVYYFDVTQGKVQDPYHNASTMISLLSQQRGYQTRYLSRVVANSSNKNDASLLHGKFSNNISKSATDDGLLIPSIVEAFDFMGVTERWLESLAVMTLLLPMLDPVDVIVLSSKHDSDSSWTRNEPTSPTTLHPEVERHHTNNIRATGSALQSGTYNENMRSKTSHSQQPVLSSTYHLVQKQQSRATTSSSSEQGPTLQCVQSVQAPSSTDELPSTLETYIQSTYYDSSTVDDPKGLPQQQQQQKQQQQHSENPDVALYQVHYAEGCL